MAATESIYASNHKDQQMLLLGFSVVFLLMTTLPREERALFITDGAGIKAFGATLPALEGGDYPEYALEFLRPYAPRAFFARTPRPRGFGGGAPALPDAVAPNSPFSALNATPAAPQDAAPTGFLPSAAPFGGSPGGGGSTFPFSPPTLGAPGSSPSGPITTVADNPPGNPPVVAPVPEPATWTMLILGFLGIGALLRRRSSAIKAAFAA